MKRIDSTLSVAPLLFGLLILPLGIAAGIKSMAIPYLLAQAGVPLDRIATISAIGYLPAVLVVLWAPLVDVKLRRRTWLAIGAFGTAFSVCLYFPLSATTHLTLMMVLLLLPGAVDALVVVACGGLIARTVKQIDQPKASAFLVTGILSGGALVGALVLWLANRMPLLAVGLCVAPLIASPGVLALSIPEPPPIPTPWFQGGFTRIFRELWTLLRSSDRRWSTLLLLGPSCTGAAQTLLPALASHYRVGVNGVVWANGLGGGLVLALGALCGTFVPGWWDRRLTYAAAGLANAFAIGVLLAGNRPNVYVVGTVLYLMTEGLCWARGTALMVEIVGPDVPDASTIYSVLNALTIIPLLYMIRLDGLSFRKFGAHGLLWADALPNVLIFTMVGLLFALRYWRARPRQVYV